MDLGEITLILVILDVCLTVWSIRILSLAMEAGIERIDAQLAGAIQKLVEGDVLGSIEPPNPIQQAIAQMLSQRMQNVPVDVTPRTPDGKFGPGELS